MNIKEAYNKIHPAVREIIETILFVLVMLIIIKFFLMEIRYIPSGSMKPTLIEKDRVYINRLGRFFSEPQRGDVMVFYPPMTELKYTPMKVLLRLTGLFCNDDAYIKRVIGMPGDKLEIKKQADGKFDILINDKPLSESYIMDSYDYEDCSDSMYCGPFIVPENEYFMMGDNRGNSKDSRVWGFLSKERFIGKATFLVWPLTRIKKL